MMIKQQKGFTLVELSIVIAILGIVFVGFATGLGTFQHSKTTSEGQLSVGNIKKQVLNFGVINKYLPCPDTDDDGLENRTNATSAILGNVQVCTNVTGMVPYLDLGLRESDAVDGWGNPIRYAVNTNANNGSLICDKRQAASMFCNFSVGTAWFSLVDTPPFADDRGDGNYYVCSDSASACNATTVATNSNVVTDTATVLLVAYNEDGANTLANCGSASGANQENCDVDDYYHQKNHTSAEGNFFDDVILALNGNEIKSLLLSQQIAWYSYTPTTNSTTLTPTYESFDIVANDTVPIENGSGQDVVLVNRNVSQSLDLKGGDDYMAIGKDLQVGSELSAGNGDDQIYIVGAALSNVLLGSGNDSMVLGGDLTNTIKAQNGDDHVWIQGNVNSGSTLLMGKGDDTLWLGNSAVPTSGNLLDAIDGGSDGGGNDYDILVLENVAQWNDLTATEQGYIHNFELVIFSDDGSGSRAYHELP